MKQYRFTNKGFSDVPHGLKVGALYKGKPNEEEGYLDVYDITTNRYYGGYCIERFEEVNLTAKELLTRFVQEQKEMLACMRQMLSLWEEIDQAAPEEWHLVEKYPFDKSFDVVTNDVLMWMEETEAKLK